MQKITALLALFLFFSAQSFAQTKGQISGGLTDTSGKKAIAYATITVFNAKDTTIITYRLSDDNGKFKVPGLPLQTPLRVVITASGYDVFRKEFTLTADMAQLQLDTLQLHTRVTELDEVLVIAERPPVVFRKDTIEFNASAFKTLPTALVEDLLKKFPGIEVDKEGNITSNGKRVNKMMVEGKEFFGTDPKIASKNLPANIIDKVQVTSDKEEMKRNPDLTVDEAGVVINLTLKKAIKQGWFGKLYAGAGTQDRFETGGIVNLFRDTLQVSLLGYANNLNRTGFSISDVMSIGGFSRNNINSVMISSDGGFALNDISFGGTGQGIQRSSGAGINMNTIISKKATLSLQYFYGQNNASLGQSVNTKQFFHDTTITTISATNATNDDYSHNLSGYLKYKIDSLSTIEYRPSFSLTKKKKNSLSNINSFSNFEDQLNESDNIQQSSASGFSMAHNINYDRSFKKKGRTLYASISMQMDNNDADQFNNIENVFYKAGTTSALDQLRQQDQQNLNANLFVSFNEPVSKDLSFRFSETASLFDNKDYIDTYEYDPATGEYIIPDEDLINGLKRSGLRTNTSAGLRYKYKKFSITPGLALKSLSIDNRFRKEPAIKQSFVYLLPALSVGFGTWNVSYNVNVNEPSVTDLQPVVNNTNSLYLQLGNPSLKPTIAHTIYLNSYVFDAKNALNYNFNLNSSFNRNAIIRERTVDADGVQVTRPVNVNGVWRTSLNGSIRKQYKFNQKWKFSAGLNGGAGYGEGILLVNNNRSKSNNINFSSGVNWSFNWDDKIELTQRYTPSWSKSSYESKVYTDLEVWRHSASSELVVRMPKHWVWESSWEYSYNPQVAPGIQKSILRWNAAVNFLFLKNDKGQFKLSVYDLLNQNTSVYRTVAENYIRDTETTILKRYVLLTFTYNIRNFAGKVGGSRNNFIMF